MPEGTPSRRILHAKGLTNYVVGGKKETQLALANLGCIAVHVWASRARAPRKPDWVCFDLDPAIGQFPGRGRAPRFIVREALDALKLVSFPKTSGGKGLHVFVPIRPGPDADAVLAFAKRLGERLAAAYPRRLTMEPRIRDRGHPRLPRSVSQCVRPDRRRALLGPQAAGRARCPRRCAGPR